MAHAIFETGGKQYRVTEGDVVFVEKLQCEADDSIVFDKILAVTNDSKTEFGTPYLRDAKIEATVMKNGKARKIIVYKMHPKKGYRRKQGHRQPYTKVQINKISN